MTGSCVDLDRAAGAQHRDRKTGWTLRFRCHIVCWCMHAVSALRGRKWTLTPELSDMQRICRLRSHAGICCCIGPETGQDFPTVRISQSETDRHSQLCLFSFSIQCYKIKLVYQELFKVDKHTGAKSEENLLIYLQLFIMQLILMSNLRKNILKLVW